MSKKFIEVTTVKFGHEPQRSLIDTNLVLTVTEILEHRSTIGSRANSIIILAQNDTVKQTIHVAETFNEIRNRLAAALS